MFKMAKLDMAVISYNNLSHQPDKNDTWVFRVAAETGMHSLTQHMFCLASYM